MKKYLSENHKLVSEWHTSKNMDQNPEDFSMYSHAKVWWKCPIGNDHEWESTIANRSTGKNCPFCSGNSVSKTNNLQAINPKLADEWHPTKNGNFNPENFTTGSNKKVWWKCPRGQDHEWYTTIASRSSGRNCPFCTGKQASKTSNLQAINPKLADEWHPTKNGNFKPENFSTGSNKKVWWKCPKSQDHIWESSIYNRSKDGGTGCPICAGSGTSQQEIRILCELRYLIGPEEVLWRSRSSGVEIDIFLPKHNIGIEYDGYYWHKGKLKSDQKKNDFLQEKNIKLIRVRQDPLRALSKNDIFCGNNLSKNNLNDLFFKINMLLKLSLKINLDAYIANSDFINEEEFKRYVSFLPSPPPEYSIFKTNPEISKEWFYEKNKPLKPENFTAMSNKSVWWKCPKGSDHEWQAKIANRSLGTNCPMCAGKKVSKTNNLIITNPKLASEWHQSLNKELKPEEFTFGSSKKVWWKCPMGDDHEWKTSINNRTKPKGTGCPFCLGGVILN